MPSVGKSSNSECDLRRSNSWWKAALADSSTAAGQGGKTLRRSSNNSVLGLPQDWFLLLNIAGGSSSSLSSPWKQSLPSWLCWSWKSSGGVIIGSTGGMDAVSTDCCRWCLNFWRSILSWRNVSERLTVASSRWRVFSVLDEWYSGQHPPPPPRCRRRRRLWLVPIKISGSAAVAASPPLILD